MAELARRIGLFDATMVVMGGIVGSGIFVTPAIVARVGGTRMIFAWLLGGLAALLGAFIYADLSARRPQAGGQHRYLRDARHPAVPLPPSLAPPPVPLDRGPAAVPDPPP